MIDKNADNPLRETRVCGLRSAHSHAHGLDQDHVLDRGHRQGRMIGPDSESAHVQQIENHKERIVVDHQHRMRMTNMRAAKSVDITAPLAMKIANRTTTISIEKIGTVEAIGRVVLQ